METPLQDPRPIIYLWDIHGFVPELTRYLYKAKKNGFIEINMLKFNNAVAPKLLGTLLDLDCYDVYIDLLLKSIRMCPIWEIVDVYDHWNKGKDLQNWLQAKATKGVQDQVLANAIAMNFIDHDTYETKNFIINDPYYDSKVVRK